MRGVFIESSEFTEWIGHFLSDDSYAEIQRRLMDNPDSGDVMPGCGGLRKLRTADPKRGKGKRGGARLIYLYVPAARHFYMLDIYGKDEKDDLTSDERNQLRTLAFELKREAKIAADRRKKER
jgi:hypothetical protein